MGAEKYEPHKNQLTEVTQEDWDLAHYKLFAISRVIKCANLELLKKVVKNLNAV